MTRASVRFVLRRLIDEVLAVPEHLRSGSSDARVSYREAVEQAIDRAEEAIARISAETNTLPSGGAGGDSVGIRLR